MRDGKVFSFDIRILYFIYVNAGCLHQQTSVFCIHFTDNAFYFFCLPSDVNLMLRSRLYLFVIDFYVKLTAKFLIQIQYLTSSY